LRSRLRLQSGWIHGEIVAADDVGHNPTFSGTVIDV
jgi:hypothetical protein